MQKKLIFIEKEKMTKIKNKIPIVAYLIFAIIIVIVIFIRYQFLVEYGQALSVKQLKEEKLKERIKRRNIIILNKDSLLTEKDSLINQLESENEDLKKTIQISI